MLSTTSRKEDYARVLDFMLTGKSFSNKPEPLAQLIGEEWFTLLEASPKPGITMTAKERVYIGADERDKIALIKSRISYDELTQTAKGELPIVLNEIVKEKEQRFVEFFNKTGPLNIREHSLELLPGVGKKHLQAIIAARNEKPFESFSDISQRVPLLQDPMKLIVDRIISELGGTQRFYLFTKPFFKREHERRYGGFGRSD
ncbi:MAG: DUF655 domain-containing protein [Candidatus Marsarchaeota archaeon]|nr:DUF655 domain-containing protein [Candidatus Marsarchaeota archaeon]MCL5112799.1 DUF655 domain-containing protein [Candidatus Marsarchaeota archaeon]